MTKQILYDKRAEAYKALEDANQKNDNYAFNEAKRSFDELSRQIMELEIQELRELDKNSDDMPISKYSSRKTELADAIIKGLEEGFETRGLTSSTGSGGLQDPLVRGDYFSEFAAKHDFFKKTGVNVISGLTNYSQWPIFSEPAVNWQGAEGDTIGDSAMTISSKKIQFRTMAILVKVSKQLLRDADTITRGAINEALMMAFMNELGRVVLRGSGSTEPRGLDSVSDLIEIDASGSSLSSWNLHLNALGKVHSYGAVVENCSWVAGTNEMLQIESFKDTTNQYLSKPPILQTMPYVYTNQVAENYSTNKTRFYLGDFSNVIVGVGGPFVLPLNQRFADTLTDAFLLWAGVDVLVKRPKELARVINIAKI